MEMPYFAVWSGAKLNVGMKVSHTPLTIRHFAGQKRQYNIFLKCSLLEPGSLDQLLLLKKRQQTKCSLGKPLTHPENFEAKSMSLVQGNSLCMQTF